MILSAPPWQNSKLGYLYVVLMYSPTPGSRHRWSLNIFFRTRSYCNPTAITAASCVECWRVATMKQNIPPPPVVLQGRRDTTVVRDRPDTPGDGERSERQNRFRLWGASLLWFAASPSSARYAVDKKRPTLLPRQCSWNQTQPASS